MARIDPASLRARCPSCGEDLWAHRDGQWTLKQRIMKLVRDSVVAVCPGKNCRAEVPIPWLKFVKPPPMAPRPARVARRVRRSPRVDEMA